MPCLFSFSFTFFSMPSSVINISKQTHTHTFKRFALPKNKKLGQHFLMWLEEIQTRFALCQIESTCNRHLSFFFLCLSFSSSVRISLVVILIATHHIWLHHCLDIVRPSMLEWHNDQLNCIISERRQTDRQTDLGKLLNKIFSLKRNVLLFVYLIKSSGVFLLELWSNAKALQLRNASLPSPRWHSTVLLCVFFHELISIIHRASVEE